MKTIETENQFIFQSEDQYGIYEIRIFKDCSQIQMESDIHGLNNDVFADIDRRELTEIRNMIDKILTQ